VFARFRQTSTRLQVSLVETRRIDGKVLHEHIAGLGSIETPPTIVSQTEKCTGLGRVASLL
jgi:hypothetical protein